jgi:hypothetical protein
MATTPSSLLHHPRHAGDLLLEALADDVLFHHPMLVAAPHGRDHVVRLWTELERVTGEVTFTHEFRGDGLTVLVWSTSLGGREVEGVNIATWSGARITELRQLLRPLPSVKRLRDAIRARLADDLSHVLWKLPANVNRRPQPFDPRQEVDAKLPVSTTEDIVFRSPLFHRALAGEALVKRGIGHAAAVYGGRTYGPRLLSGRQALTQWEGAVAGRPIHAANLSTFDEQGRMKELSLFMGPVPTLELFYDHVRPRLETFLDAEYFGE